MIPQEQTEQIKKQLIEQISSTFPEDKKASAIQQIESMNAEQLKEFLIQNKLIKVSEDGQEVPQEQQCIFCSIINEKMPSYKIDENSQAIAILEINPVSKAHALIIPKKHISSGEKISSGVFSLATKIAKKIKSKFKPKDVTISSSNLFGHEIINVLPVYESETLNSQRNTAKPEDLEKLKNLLEKKSRTKRVKKIKTKKIEKHEYLKLPRRIP